MLIVVQNNTCKVVQATDQELGFVYRFLSFRNTAAERQRKAGYEVDDMVRMFSLKTRRFPTGMLPLLHKHATIAKFEVQVLDQRNGPAPAELPEPVLDWLKAPPWTLRDYQLEIMQQVAKPTKPYSLPGRGIIWSPTGSGKGTIAVAIAATFPGPWVFLVHRNHLADDIAERWESRTGKKAGWVTGTEVRFGSQYEFTVATMQSLITRLGRDSKIDAWAQTIKGIIVDECHVCPAKMGSGTITKFANAYWRIGLSGTPLDRGDQRSLVAVGLLGPVLYRIKPETLMEAGYLARPTIHMLPCYQDQEVDSWSEAYDSLIVSSDQRNRLVIDALVKCEKPAMVFVQRIEHGHDLVRRAERAGLTVRFVNGKTGGKEGARQRKQACKDLASARLDAIITTDVFNEGVDIPCLRTVVLAAGGKSWIKALQQVGRALRISKDKTTATIYDVLDTGNRWLERHAVRRMAAFTREGYNVVQDHG